MQDNYYYNDGVDDDWSRCIGVKYNYERRQYCFNKLLIIIWRSSHLTFTIN